MLYSVAGLKRYYQNEVTLETWLIIRWLSREKKYVKIQDSRNHSFNRENLCMLKSSISVATPQIQHISIVKFSPPYNTHVWITICILVNFYVFIIVFVQKRKKNIKHTTKICNYQNYNTMYVSVECQIGKVFNLMENIIINK